MFTRQHYKEIARILGKNRQDHEYICAGEIHHKYYYREELMDDLITFFKQDNPLFQEEKFIEEIERSQ